MPALCLERAGGRAINGKAGDAGSVKKVDFPELLEVLRARGSQLSDSLT